MQKLPVGIQTFRTIIEGDYLYIDKTEIARALIDNYRYVFLSRPRRFGKSLFLDTLKNIFEGKRELFRGLLIEEQWNWEVTWPVIKISFSGGVHSKADLEVDLLHILKSNEERLGLKCENRSRAQYFFAELIKKASEKYKQKVVILVDEYDKPILDNLEKPSLATQLYDMLKDFYGAFKPLDPWLRFVFLTGVSKFAKAGIFSGLNNLKDITVDARYSAICGYTQADLETVFVDRLDGLDLEAVCT